MRAALILACAATLAACGERAVDASTGAGTGAGASAGPAVKSGPYDVSERGVGPLGDDTPFTAQAVVAAYPDARVERQVFSFAENSEPMWRADAPDGTALEVFGDVDETVSRVLVAGGPFMGPGGTKLLQPWSETGFKVAQCRAGEGRWLNNVVCRRPEDSNVQVIFAVPGWTGEAMPPEAALRERAKLSAFYWTQGAR